MSCQRELIYLLLDLWSVNVPFLFECEHSKETGSVCDTGCVVWLGTKGSLTLALWVLGVDYIAGDPVGKSGLGILVAFDVICVKPELY